VAVSGDGARLSQQAVVGYATDDNYKTPLIAAAIEAAARNIAFHDGAVFHSDRGSNYTSFEFAGALAAAGLTQSVGRTGICSDCDDPGVLLLAV